MHFSGFLSKKAKPDAAVKRTVTELHRGRQPSPWQVRFFRWADKRVPLATDVLLTRKNVYTLPTLTGFSFLGLGFVLWLLGTSYQNNLILALSYLLVSLIVVAIFHSYANLAGLQIKVLGAKPAFVGENVYFMLQIQGARAQGYENLTIRWWNGENASFDFEGKKSTQIRVGVYADKRGILQPGKLLIESCFPLGIIRCWTWLNLDAHAVIFPKPLQMTFPKQPLGDSDSEHGEQISGGDDFTGLKEYRAGDPIKHIAWKHYAREQGLYSKEYGRAPRRDSYLQWDAFSHLPAEERLSALCYWALEFDRTGITYGLRLPGKEFAPACSDGHRLNVLSALALFDINLGGH
jgi:uncharacterized protein (DUF58 family)